ncbi:MAG: hypothetical protein JWN16_346 [Alphaproteobacteria bacterium]|nr:hypothetical protein [Alphaproteobacteria bacterium]
MTATLETRLAVYGSLAPGKPNAHKLAHLAGHWRKGMVRGKLVDEGWGAGMGFPALVLNDEAQTVPVDLLESPDLPAHWALLDAFEGAGYRRIATAVDVAGEKLPAYIYVLA